MPDIDTAVRTGDIFANLVEHFSECGNYESAYRRVMKCSLCLFFFRSALFRGLKGSPRESNQGVGMKWSLCVFWLRFLGAL